MNLISDLGQLLSRYYQCAPAAYSDSAVLLSINPDLSNVTWIAEAIGDKIAFRSENGKYLSRCSYCWKNAKYNDAAFVYIDSPTDPEAQWSPEYMGEGRWTLRGKNGYYLSICNGCLYSIYSNYAFVHSDYPYLSSQWKILI